MIRYTPNWTVRDSIKNPSSWSSDHEHVDFEVLARVAKATSADEVPAIMALSQDSVDPEGRSSANLAKELPGIPEEEVLRDLEGNFFPGLIQSTIRELNLERLRKFQILSILS